MINILCAFLGRDAQEQEVIANTGLTKTVKAEKLARLFANTTTQKLMGRTTE
ncbi:hypothetical protein R5H30_19770 [Sulfitobacter sp. D35]|uniref:hypothetical protein n=1 Tax=Sulfitobacter sp. D35 TaxID=3083252 RepID=UPI00296F5F66|nr:hypothetical protein [Sulfitobacter sp. D35]MDW4500235.1 hypothetical protein [Sulfitobacter sp. D35]